MRTDRRRSGFTLLEVIVAIAVGALVVLGARAMLGAVADGGDAARAAARAADGEANAEAVLRRLVADLEVGTDGATRFAGDSVRATFWTWCPVAGGWIERCRAALSIDEEAGQVALVVRLSTRDASIGDRWAEERLALRSGLDHAHFVFLSDAALGGRWFRAWGEGVTAPLAIGLVADSAGRADTLILRIGERG